MKSIPGIFFIIKGMPTEEELFSTLVSEILAATERLGEEACLEEDLPTAADIARKFNFRLEAVKKKLKVLKEQELIQAISVTPKRYRFNLWALRTLEESHVLYGLFCEPESPYYIEH